MTDKYLLLFVHFTSAVTHLTFHGPQLTSDQPVLSKMAVVPVQTTSLRVEAGLTASVQLCQTETSYLSYSGVLLPVVSLFQNVSLIVWETEMLSAVKIY